MDNKKTDQYYIQKIVTDIEFIIAHTAGLTIEQLEDNEVLVDSVMFRLIQVSENSDKLTESFKEQHKEFLCRYGQAYRILGHRNRRVTDETIKAEARNMKDIGRL